LVLLLASHCAPGGAERPNVVLIVLDTTRADYLSSYGFPKPTTPFMDRLASEGVLFRNAFTTSFWTLPAHVTLFTGLYPAEAGVAPYSLQLAEDVTTLAEQLAEDGYRTAAAVCNTWISAERGFRQGFDRYFEAWRPEGRQPSVSEEASAIDQLRELLETPNPRGPFFFFLNLNTTHLPYAPPLPAARRFSDPSHFQRVRLLSKIKNPWPHFTGRMRLSENDYRILRNLYAAEVGQVDSYVGQVTDLLQEHGALDDTLIIVTADHGEDIGEHDRIGHLLVMHDTTMRVPLIVRYPPEFPAGQVVDDMVSLLDVAPTVLEIAAGVTSPRTLARRSEHPREFVFAENPPPVKPIEVLKENFPEFDTRKMDHPMRMIRTSRHKLIWHVGKRAELYDLDSDPGETSDVGESHSEIRDALLLELDKWASELPRRIGEPFDASDAKALEQLRELGYIQ
jgi:arylsulfatase A-like enzyme